MRKQATCSKVGCYYFILGVSSTTLVGLRAFSLSRRDRSSGRGNGMMVDVMFYSRQECVGGSQVGCSANTL